MSNLEISIVLGTYNRLLFLQKTIETIRREINGLTAEIIVVDGGSTDGTLEWLIIQKDIITIIQHNRGVWNNKKIERKSWGYFMNLGFKCAQGKYICMLSDDCLVVPKAIKNGLKLFNRKLKNREKVGAMAFYWRNWPKQKKYWVGLIFGNNMYVNHGMYLKKALEDVNFIDEDSYFFYHADGDLCLKMRQKGYKCIDSPDSYIEHYQEANLMVRASNTRRQKKDWEAFVNKWRNKYNTNEQGWIEKDYHDQTQTALKYWGLKREAISYSLGLVQFVIPPYFGGLRKIIGAKLGRGPKIH